MFRSFFALALVLCSVAHANPTAVVAISAGSEVADGNFLADSYFSGGSTYTNNIPVNRTNVTDPAPLSVYQSTRFGNFNYVIGGLTAGVGYKIRLHFAEVYWSAPGARRFNVYVNGDLALGDFDIFSAAGGKGIAVIREVTAPANGLGNLVLAFSTIVDNAQINGIEVVPVVPTEPVPVNPIFKLEANKASYSVGDSASLVVHYLAAPESPEFEYYSTSTLNGVALPVTNASRNFAVAVTPPLENIGPQIWSVSVFLQSKELARSLEETIAFLQAENERIEKSLDETTDPDTIASLENERARNLVLIERAQAELTAGRRPVSSPRSLTINVL